MRAVEVITKEYFEGQSIYLSIFSTKWVRLRRNIYLILVIKIKKLLNVNHTNGLLEVIFRAQSLMFGMKQCIIFSIAPDDYKQK